MKERSASHIRKLVVTGALGALAVFLGITKLGFIPWFTGISITIIHIPAILGAVLEGPLVGSGIGAIFGLFSMIQANIGPNGPIDLAFRNPLVSVLPRILFPVAAWGIYALVAKWKKIPAVIIAAAAGSVIHTVLVLGMLVLTNGSGILTGGDPAVTVWAVLGAIFAANGIPESIAAAVLSTVVVAAKLGINSANRKSKLNS